MSKIGVVGVGYVGLTQAVGMAQLGHSVIAYDIDLDKIEKLKSGTSPFFEPGLEENLKKNLEDKQIFFTINLNDLKEARFIFLCLPTPQGEDGSADTSHLLSAVNSIAPHLDSDTILIIKSTVPVNSWKRVSQELSRSDIHIVSNPEFLREGSALKDFHQPDRIVIGSSSISISEEIKKLYSGVKTNFVLTDNTSAELIKYAANSFLAIKLSFVNDISALCENLSANSKDVLFGVGLDQRIGNKFLTPGPGWGGSCFPKDVRALANIADKENLLMPLLGAAIESNANAHERIVQKIVSYFDNLANMNIAALGLAFKANTDDVRNSPAIEIIKKLQALNANVMAFDPAVKSISGIKTAKTTYEVFHQCDLILVLTEWDLFKSIDPFEINKIVSQKFVLDARAIFDKEQWIAADFEFI